MKGASLPHRIDLGDGRYLTFFVNLDDDVLGCIEIHPSLKDTRGVKGSYGLAVGEPCSGSLYFRVPENSSVSRPSWEVISWSPLTLSPSVLCTLCGNHGFVRNGLWESAS